MTKSILLKELRKQKVRELRKLKEPRLLTIEGKPVKEIKMSQNKIEELKKGCGKEDGFKRKCGNIFETYKDGITNRIIQEIRYYCPTCQAKLEERKIGGS